MNLALPPDLLCTCGTMLQACSSAKQGSHTATRQVRMTALGVQAGLHQCFNTPTPHPWDMEDRSHLQERLGSVAGGVCV